MSRRNVARKRLIAPDSKYKCLIVAKCVNSIMKNGKKHVANSILYGAFNIIEINTGSNPYDIFIGAINNIKPTVEVVVLRLGGATYHVPSPISGERSLFLAITLLLKHARKRRRRSSAMSLAEEIQDAFEHKGGAIKERHDQNKIAEANRAFAHLNPKNNKRAYDDKRE